MLIDTVKLKLFINFLEPAFFPFSSDFIQCKYFVVLEKVQVYTLKLYSDLRKYCSCQSFSV